MDLFDGARRVHPGWWTVVLFATLATLIFVAMSLFFGTFRSYVPVTLMSDRAGLVMESGAKVKLRGVEVGRVTAVEGETGAVNLHLRIYPDQVKYIPGNVEAQIRATTTFGAKYVDLVYPEHPSARRIGAGDEIRSRNVSTEINTVFQNLVDVLHRIDPAKLNAVLSALAGGLRGQGTRIGEATTDGNQVLLALNSRTATIRRGWHSLQGFSDTYSAAATDILTALNAASTTSVTITTKAQALDSLLTGVIGFSRSGVDLIGPNERTLIDGINILEPTTGLLLKYKPELTCMLVGAKWGLDNGGYAAAGGNGSSVVLDASVMLAADPYKYPQNLPIIGAKGGPGGRPGCGSLPIVDNNWPLRQLITNTGWGTGVDIRPNPGIAHPAYIDFLPVTRAVPEPPSVRLQGGPAPGPIPYPGAPPYGARQYAPDGTPLYPGLPPAPPPGDQRPDPNMPPLPGAEPFIVPAPASMQPTPAPPSAPPPGG